MLVRISRHLSQSIMKKKLLSLMKLGLFTLFPWVVFLLKDAPVKALLALGLQASFIGWIPASIWSYTTHKKYQKKKQTT